MFIILEKQMSKFKKPISTREFCELCSAKEKKKIDLFILREQRVFVCLFVCFIAKISMTSPIDINVPTRAFLDAETKSSFVQWLANFNIKRTLTSMFVNRYLPYVIFCSMLCFW